MFKNKFKKKKKKKTVLDFLDKFLPHLYSYLMNVQERIKQLYSLLNHHPYARPLHSKLVMLENPRQPQGLIVFLFFSFLLFAKYNHHHVNA
jgi:hypothetical protein